MITFGLAGPMEPSSVARAMLPETSTALSAANRLKTSSRQPEKLGFVSKTVTGTFVERGCPGIPFAPPRRSRCHQVEPDPAEAALGGAVAAMTLIEAFSRASN